MTALVRSLPWICALALIMGLAAWPTRASEQEEKLPVPEEPAQKAAVELVRNIFKVEYEAAKTPLDRLALAGKILKTADETKGDPAGRYALLVVAKDLAAAEGDLKLVQSAVGELGKSYRIDELALLEDTLAFAGKAVRENEAQRKIAQLALSLIDRAETADRYLVARDLGKTALDAARAIRDAALVKRIQARMGELEQLEAAHRLTEDARLTLVERPTDPEANLAVGKFDCFLKGQWETGIPMLALGSDPRLQELAKKELQGVASAEEQAAIGDAWWDLAESTDALSQQHLREHAANWYEQAAPKLTGLRKAAAEKRIADSLPPLESLSLPDGAVLVFTFEEKTFFRQGNALLVRDLSGEGNHGLVAGTQPAPGRAGTALSFDAKKAYVECRDAESLNPTDAFTICAWINARDWRGDAIDYVISKDDWKDDPRGFVLRGMENGRISVTVGAKVWRASPSKERLATEEWHHLAATLGGGRLTLYVNAVAKNTVAVPVPVVPSPYLLRVGRGHFADERGFNGVIDEVAIFNRALTSDEIKSIYELGVAGANLTR